ncbi:MAG: TonB-dependent receptor [Pseudomarimonas sp.]
MLHSVSRRLLVSAVAFSLFGPSAHASTTTIASVETEAESEAAALAASKSDPYLAPEVSVTAKGTAADVPSALATDVVSWQDQLAAPVDFQDLIIRVPGVGATGQNGLFETFSIRGSGGNGILILVGGTPLTAQRRAGVPVAFVEPSLLGEINVTRGPATVHFGPGALGGAVSIEPRWFDSATASVGYATAGDDRSVMAGFGNDAYSIGVASHHAGDSEAGNGTPLNTSYQRESASLQYRADMGGFAFDALLLPSKADDIGRSNNRFPVRDTTVPEDDHVLGRLRLRHDTGFEVSVHGHDQSLLTYNQRPGFADTFAYVESLDIGATVQKTWVIGDFSNNVGIEYLQRSDVNGFSATGTLATRTFSLRDADEQAWSLFALSDWRPSSTFALEAGARFSAQDQAQATADSSDSDRAFTFGAAWTPTDASRWTLNLSTGYRFATLEERFFTGVTAQGEILGNPDLGSESSQGIDLGYSWHGGAWDVQVHGWQTDVDDLIQLFLVAPGVNGYTNVGQAKLHGFDGAVGWTPTGNFSLRAIGTLVRSKDELTGDPLYGSPPLTVALDARYTFSAVTLGAYYSHRARMDRPGFEEVERDSADFLDLDLSWRLTPAWNLKLFARNALDADDFATADVLSTFVQERSFGINLTWSGR